MKIELNNITIRELAKDYVENAEEGVKGYGGALDIRPPYQREFVYRDKQRDAVIDTVLKGFPLNVMYWAKLDDGNFEIIDGQQRTISVCRYANNDFSYNGLSISNHPSDIAEKFLDYKLMIYQCSGEPSERLEWFKTINIAGEPLTDQELRNAVYSGQWVTSAKRFFSKTNCPAHNLGKDYFNNSVQAIRQEYLEVAIKWISNGEIIEYMSKHQHDSNADAIKDYFQDVIEWIEKTFTVKRKEMKGVDWGSLYRKFGDKELDSASLEKEISKLMEDEDVTNNHGIYKYVLTGDERCLSMRAFGDKVIRSRYEQQKGICPLCGDEFELGQMHADHITPWSEGGKTLPENCQMLCRDCNLRKSNQR